MVGSKKLLGLPVISVGDGLQVGSVVALVVDPGEGAVSAIAIEGRRWYEGLRFIPSGSIQRLGDAAVTIDGASSVVNLSSVPEIKSNAKANIRIIGSTMFTREGANLGVISEYFVDEHDHTIVELEVKSPSGDVSRVAGDRIVSLGKDVAIVDADPQLPHEPIPSGEPVTEPDRPRQDSVPCPPASDDLSALFQSRMEARLIGKPAGATIRSEDGTILVEEGAQIGRAVIDRVKAAGRLQQLSNSVEID